MLQVQTYRLWTRVALVFVMTSIQELSLAELVSRCGFEIDFCGWSNNASWANGSWTRSQSPRSANTGPASAQLGVGGTFFIFLKTSDFKNSQGFIISGQTVALVTNVLPTVKCVVFLYMKHGQAMGKLSVGVARPDETRKELWTNVESGKNIPQWECSNITVSNFNKSQIYFEAESGLNVNGDIALDEVFIFNENCGTEKYSACDQILALSSPVPPLTTTTTSAATSSSSLSQTTTTNPASSTTVLSTQTETPFPEELLYIIIVLVVLLIVTVVVAVVCFLRRRSQNPPTDCPRDPPEEMYDQPNESEMAQHRPVVNRAQSNTYNPLNDKVKKKDDEDEAYKYHEIDNSQVRNSTTSTTFDEPIDYTYSEIDDRQVRSSTTRTPNYEPTDYYLELVS